MGHMGHVGLGTVLGWLVGWCGSVADPISQDQVQYVLYLERLAYEPNVSEV